MIISNAVSSCLNKQVCRWQRVNSLIVRHTTQSIFIHVYIFQHLPLVSEYEEAISPNFRAKPPVVQFHSVISWNTGLGRAASGEFFGRTIPANSRERIVNKEYALGMHTIGIRSQHLVIRY